MDFIKTGEMNFVQKLITFSFVYGNKLKIGSPLFSAALVDEDTNKDLKNLLLKNNKTILLLLEDDHDVYEKILTKSEEPKNFSNSYYIDYHLFTSSRGKRELDFYISLNNSNI